MLERTFRNIEHAVKKISFQYSIRDARQAEMRRKREGVDQDAFNTLLEMLLFRFLLWPCV